MNASLRARFGSVRPLRVLLGTMLREQLRPWLGVTSLGLVIILVGAPRYGPSHLALLVALNCAAGLQWRRGIGRNLPWLGALPLSKTQILLLGYFSNLCIVALYASSWIITLGIIGFVRRDILGDAQWIQDSERVFGGETSLVGLIELAAYVLLLYVHAICANSLGSWVRRQNPTVKQWQVCGRRALVWLPVLIFGALLVARVMQKFNGFLACSIIASLFVGATLISWRLFRDPTWRLAWLPLVGVNLGGMLAITGGIYLHYRADEQSGVPSLVARAMVELDGLGLRYPQGQFAHILMADLDFIDLAMVGLRYVQRYHQGRPIVDGSDPHLSFRQALLRRFDSREISLTVGLFEVETLKRESLDWFTARLDHLHLYRNLAEFLPVIAAFSARTLTEADLRHWLESPSPSAIAWALIRCRRGDYPHLAEVIEANAAHYPEDLQEVTLGSLSFLYRQKVGLDQWTELVEWGKIHSLRVREKPDCHAVVRYLTNMVEPEQMRLLNCCIRALPPLSKFVDTERLEAQGWLSAPLDEEMQRGFTLLAQYYRERKPRMTGG